MYGRPTKYKKEYCRELEQHMNDGFSFESFGGKLGVTEKTLHNWKNKHKDFLQSYKRGRLKSMLHWEEMGHDMVLAGQGNATVWIFNMKNRFGWKDKQEIEQSGDLNVNINDYGTKHNTTTKTKNST